MSDELLGVLRTPIDLAMSTDLARTQYWFRGQEAADRIEAQIPQPIDTAPKDGSEILVYFRTIGWKSVAWIGDEDGSWCVDDYKHGPFPVRGYPPFGATHWMLLPREPA